MQSGYKLKYALLYFCSMAERPTDKVTYILDVQETFTKQFQPSILNNNKKNKMSKGQAKCLQSSFAIKKLQKLHFNIIKSYLKYDINIVIHYSLK